MISGDKKRVKAIKVFLLLVLLTTSLLPACRVGQYPQEQESAPLTLTLDKIQCEELSLDDKSIYRKGAIFILDGKIDYDPSRISELDSVVLVLTVHRGSITRLQKGVTILLHSNGTSTFKGHIDAIDGYDCSNLLFNLWFETPEGYRIHHQGDFDDSL